MASSTLKGDHGRSDVNLAEIIYEYHCACARQVPHNLWRVHHLFGSNAHLHVPKRLDIVRRLIAHDLVINAFGEQRPGENGGTASPLGSRGQARPQADQAEVEACLLEYFATTMTNDEELHPAAMLDYVLAYSPVILAVLAAQLAASTSSLRYWLAVCAIPESIPVEGPKPEVPPEKHQSWWSGILPIAAIAVVFSVTVAMCNIYRAMGRDFPELDGVLSVNLFPVAIFVMISYFSTFLVRPAVSVHRNSAGALVNIPSKSSNSKTLFMIYLFLSIAIYIGTFIAESNVFIIFTIFASIVMFSWWIRGYNSLMPFGIAFICCIVAITTVTVLLLFSNGAKSWIDLRKSPNSYINQSLKRVMVYVYWANATAWSSLSASFTSFCLRFDHHTHLEHSGNRYTENFAIDKIPSPLSVPGVGPGAVVPSCIPTKFSKPYFYTSMVTFVFAAAATLACLPLLGIVLDRLPANIFMTVMIVAVFPLQYIAVIRMAKLRGEWQILSQYKEEWIRKPIPSKSVIDVEEGSGGKVG